ncbi:kelch-like protein 28 [Amphiura filiformis]|uniref:kelch-like protein 28 n=1 Tax=Amphiura filiformis TaxID=82378 RepID=UPI003B21E329
MSKMNVKSQELYFNPFRNEHSYPRQLSQALNDLREENQLCDIIINVGGRAFNAHKAVLAASSSYFKAMFTSGFKESTEKEISIEGNPDVFKVLIHYAYTGVLKMSALTAFDVLDMACYMQFTQVYKTCANFIEGCFKAKSENNRIPLCDALKMYMLAKNHDHLEELATAAVKFMEDNVQQLIRSEAFLQNASVSFLESFLCREELATANGEKQVLELVINWLKQDWETRHTHAHSLLSKIRLGLVTPEHLTELITKDILEKPECKALVDEVLQLRTSSQSVTTLSLKSPQLFATRSTITAPISPCIGETYGITSCNFKYYHTTQQCWKPLKRFSTLLHCASYQSVMVVNGKLFLAGGLDQHEEIDMDDMFHDSDSDSDWDDDYEEPARYKFTPVGQKHFFCYHTVENKWSKLPAMKVARNSFPMVQLGGYIYAIAGSNASGIEISDVERFDLRKKEWEILPRLPERCRSISAVAFKGKIIVHGITPAADNPTTSRPHLKYVLQVYHPNSKYWQSVHSEVREVNQEGNIVDRRPTNPPHLFVYKGICYRVSYAKVQSDTPKNMAWYDTPKHKPVVHALEFHSQSNAAAAADGILVKVGESINQDYIPENMVGAFRISDEVFVSVNGFSYNTGISISSEQSTDVDVDQWRPFNDIKRLDDNILIKGQEGLTCFTFDRMKLEN